MHPLSSTLYLPLIFSGVEKGCTGNELVKNQMECFPIFKHCCSKSSLPINPTQIMYIGKSSLVGQPRIDDKMQPHIDHDMQPRIDDKSSLMKS